MLWNNTASPSNPSLWVSRFCLGRAALLFLANDSADVLEPRILVKQPLLMYGNWIVWSIEFAQSEKIEYF